MFEIKYYKNQHTTKLNIDKFYRNTIEKSKQATTEIFFAEFLFLLEAKYIVLSIKNPLKKYLHKFLSNINFPFSCLNHKFKVYSHYSWYPYALLILSFIKEVTFEPSN